MPDYAVSAPPTTRRPDCPECGTTGIPIGYGYPSGPLFAASEVGFVALGGCVVTEDQPTWQCPACGQSWEGPNPAKAIREAVRKVGSGIL